MDFFAKHNNWSDSTRNAVKAIHKWQRVACRICRRAYEDYACLKRNPMESDTLEDTLRGERTFTRSVDKSFFARSFYCGGLFDSRRCGKMAYFSQMALASLESQRIAEEVRYKLKHGRYSDNKEEASAAMADW